MILDLDQAALDSLVQHLREHLNVEALGLRCDIADAEAVQRSVALAVERFGGIDVLVNNAGITHRSLFIETELAVFRRVMAVNFYGALHCTQAALPSLLARHGQIVVLSSLTGFAPLLYRSAYNASKHALHGLFDTLRMELDGTGVAITLACPGFTATDLRKNALVGDGSVIRQPALVLGAEVASPRDVAEAIYQARCAAGGCWCCPTSTGGRGCWRASSRGCSRSCWYRRCRGSGRETECPGACSLSLRSGARSQGWVEGTPRGTALPGMSPSPP